MRACSLCLRQVPAEATACPHDGHGLLPLTPSADLGAPVAALAPGSMLTRSYRVERLIGAGGMGVVYEVEHVRLRKRFAAKLLLRDAAHDPEALERLEREAVAASRIRHPNIVEVVNFDETADGHTFIVEELLLGFDLSRLCTGTPLPCGLALAIGVTVARALAVAHGVGIIHRDLKPANVFLAQQGDSVQVKVLDFGISKILGDDERVRLTTTGVFIGTPAYMAPELAREGAPVDARTDVYSLGVILYELLSGAPPFVSKNLLDVALKHVMEAPAPLSARHAAVPPEVEAVVLQALAKAPDARFATMAALADALEEAARRAGVVLAPMPEQALLASSVPSPPPPTPRPTPPTFAPASSPEPVSSPRPASSPEPVSSPRPASSPEPPSARPPVGPRPWGLVLGLLLALAVGAALYAQRPGATEAHAPVSVSPAAPSASPVSPSASPLVSPVSPSASPLAASAVPRATPAAAVTPAPTTPPPALDSPRASPVAGHGRPSVRPAPARTPSPRPIDLPEAR